MRIFYNNHIARMRAFINKCKNSEELFTQLPNPDGTVDLHMNQKMFDKAIEPFCRKMVER